MSERITATIYDAHRERLDELADEHEMQSDAEVIRWCIENASERTEPDADLDDVLGALETHDADTSGTLADIHQAAQRIEQRMATADQIETYQEDEGSWWSNLLDR